MTWLRSRGISRTTIAATIVLVAVGLPCAAWFLAGSRAASQEAERIERAPTRRADEQARGLAVRLAQQLESLRLSESRRPFTDYHDHDEAIEQDCRCDTRLASPLSEGPVHPLVWAHFEIDELGRLMLPTLAGRGPETDPALAGKVAVIQHAILDQLECAATERLTGAAPESPSVRTVEIQNEDSSWVVTVGPLAWQTLKIEAEDALVASREVTTPGAVLTQGFVVRASDLAPLISDVEAPATLRPGPPLADGEAAVRLEGQTWTVAVDPSEKLQTAVAAAAGVRKRFLRGFTVGLVAALLGGVLVVGIVWQAERLAFERARFAASAAHELRTPLTGLRMYGEMLADGSGDPEHERGYARRIAGEAERLGRVVSNLLGFSKLERGVLRAHCVSGDLAAVVRSSVDELRPAVESAGAKLELSIGDALPPTRFDRDAVHQILQNLVDNADKYSRSGADRTIRVVLDHEGPASRLSVIDRGPGVAAALRRRLFEPFVRGAGPDAPAGLGLGLALVDALARAQNATAGYRPMSHGGSRFFVTFPAV